MKTRVLLLSISILLLFSSCSKQELNSVKSQNIKVISDEPLWLKDPSYSGYIGAVGITKIITNKIKQEKIAMLKAKAELAKNIKVQIKSELIKIKKGEDSKYEKTIKLSTSQMLKKVIKKDSYEKDGFYYVWIIIQGENDE